MNKKSWIYSRQLGKIRSPDNREGEQGVDRNNEREVHEYLEENNYRTRLYKKDNLNRLDDNNPLTKPITVFDILRILRNFKNKAPGESGITQNMLLHLLQIAIERLRDLVSLLLSIGYFTVVYKNGIMIMTPKAEKDSRDPLNYRPITLLEIPGKILERVVNDRLYNYLENNNIMNKNQFGLNRGYRTEQAILKIYEMVAINQERTTSLQHSLQSCHKNV